MIYPLLSKTENDLELLRDTLKHLEMFADDSLRTLTIARHRMDEKQYLDWSARFSAANASLEIEKRKNNQPNEID